MILSELSIRRPVVSIVCCLLLLLVGLLAFATLPVREYPDTDSPVVSVTTTYPGASAAVVESRVTDPLEEQLATIDGIRLISSVSQEQVSRITIEFDLVHNVEEAANDVRDRVSRVRNRLPTEVLEPQVEKTDGDSSPFIWMTMFSDDHSRLELTAFADRFGKRVLQILPGVGNIVIGGERRYAMRIWLDASRLAAHNLTPAEVEQALRRQNVDIPGGRIESAASELPIRLVGDLATPQEFERVVLATRGETQILLSDVARVELGSEDYRTRTYFNGIEAVGLGVVRQSQSNMLEVSQHVREAIPSIRAQLPEGVSLQLAVDRADFVRESVKEVYKTLFFAFILVIFVVFFFLRSARATIIPLLAVPVSVVGTFFFMNLLGFSINILTLLALVLAVGLVIDDAIVMLENIYRRIEEGEPPLKAAYLGSRQVAFAIIATTLSLVAVFIPVAFQQGSTGRLFYEFGITLAIAVSVSSFVALTLTPMLCSKYLQGAKGQGQAVSHSWLHRWTEPGFLWANRVYARLLDQSLRAWPLVLIGAVLVGSGGFFLYPNLQRELVPLEDRGVFISFFRGPQGAGPDYTRSYIADMEALVREVPEVTRNFSISAFAFGSPGLGNQGLMFTGLKHWDERERSTQQIVGEMAGKYGQHITGGMAFPVPIRPLGQRGAGQDINFVLLGQDYEELNSIAGEMLGQMQQSGLFLRPRSDPAMNKPQLDVTVQRQRAADLGVEVRDVATTLETLMGGRRVTQFRRGNEEYEVIVQIEDAERTSPSDLNRLYVRGNNGALIQLGNLVESSESLVPENFPHFNRLRSVSIVSQMQDGVTIGDGVAFLEQLASQTLPQGMQYAWDGVSREFVDAEGATLFLFGLALVFAFLVLAAQFESFVHPLTIFSGVALAISGGLAVLYASRFWGDPLTDNLFSRFGLIMLIGLVAKNGILIVEFANQLQIEGRKAFDAAREAAILRFRPILMTAITTICGVLPLALASGAGAETRNPLGIVIIGGLGLATILTLFVVPVVYILFDRIVVKVTGHSSAHGLKRSYEIPREMAEASKTSP